ncbi:MAG: Jag N-terminal domain-containing protein [Endomicrobium sp.]|jgi:spoIIIJ-associated protein|nr:Jag N-terminal domain-containing protein [Endomicrobium sp.]
MPEIESKGKTVADAITDGLFQLGCSKKDAVVKVVSEGSKGLFGLMGAKPAIVLISADESKCANRVFVDFDPKKVCKRIEHVLAEILTKMNLNYYKIETFFNDNSVNINIMSNNGSFIIGKNGQTLDSLEYITEIIVNREFKSKFKVNLDSESYRRKQIEKLQIIVNKAVEYVNRTGKIYRFDPMSAKERKIIHLYLKDDPSVESFSEGCGMLRKVGIKPADKKLKHFLAILF